MNMISVSTLEKWQRRARLFQEAYKEKSFEATSLLMQKVQLEAFGVDKVLPMQNRSLRHSLLVCARKRNALLEACEAQERLETEAAECEE